MARRTGKEELDQGYLKLVGMAGVHGTLLRAMRQQVEALWETTRAFPSFTDHTAAHADRVRARGSDL